MGRLAGVGASVLLAMVILWLPAIAELRDAVRVYVPQASFVGHFAVCAGLAWVLWRAWGRGMPFLTLGLVALLATALELGQGFIPGRAIQVEDLWANGGGAAMGIALAWLSHRVMGRRSNGTRHI